MFHFCDLALSHDFSRFLFSGLKSYGKVVYVFTILPIFGMTLLCAKLLGFLPGTSKDRSFLPETDWGEFFLNSKVSIRK